MPWTWLAGSVAWSQSLSRCPDFSALTLPPASRAAVRLPCPGWASFVRLVASLYQFVMVGKILFPQGQASCPHMYLVLYNLTAPGALPACYCDRPQ